MLINIDETLFNQDKINFFSFNTYAYQGHTNTRVTVDMNENHEQHQYEIKYLQDKDYSVVNDELKSLKKFLCTSFGKVGIILTLNDSNRIGAYIYD